MRHCAPTSRSCSQTPARCSFNDLSCPIRPPGVEHECTEPGRGRRRLRHIPGPERWNRRSLSMTASTTSPPRIGVPFCHVPSAGPDKPAAEAEHLRLRLRLRLLKDNADFLVLARYMQILSGAYIAKIGMPIINIHHSFLPAFIGAGPYTKARERGVKLIGATAHYVTEDLRPGADHRVGRRPRLPLRHRRRPAAPWCRCGAAGALPRGEVAQLGPCHPDRQPHHRLRLDPFC